MTIKNSFVFTQQLLQVPILEETISRIDEESKSGLNSSRAKSQELSEVSEDLSRIESKLGKRLLSNTGVSKRSHSPLLVHSNNTGTSEERSGMMQTIQKVILGRPSIRKLRGTINLGITGAKLVDSFQNKTLPRTNEDHTASDHRQSEILHSVEKSNDLDTEQREGVLYKLK
jgi:hypothetical protein